MRKCVYWNGEKLCQGCHVWRLPDAVFSGNDVGSSGRLTVVCPECESMTIYLSALRQAHPEQVRL